MKIRLETTHLEPVEREYIVELNFKEKEELSRWLNRPNGGCYFTRASFELVEGGGILVRTRPYKPTFSKP
jgi:hypothetical protein